MSAVTQLPTNKDSARAPSGHNVLAYLRERRHDDHSIPLSEMARRVGIAPEFLAGAIWGATELSNSDVAHLVRAQAGELDPQVTDHHLSDADSHQPGWPTVVAKEGSD